jgi:hypothetical protein
VDNTTSDRASESHALGKPPVLHVILSAPHSRTAPGVPALPFHQSLFNSLVLNRSWCNTTIRLALLTVNEQNEGYGDSSQSIRAKNSAS